MSSRVFARPHPCFFDCPPQSHEKEPRQRGCLVYESPYIQLARFDRNPPSARPEVAVIADVSFPSLRRNNLLESIVPRQLILRSRRRDRVFSVSQTCSPKVLCSCPRVSLCLRSDRTADDFATFPPPSTPGRGLLRQRLRSTSRHRRRTLRAAASAVTATSPPSQDEVE